MTTMALVRKSLAFATFSLCLALGLGAGVASAQEDQPLQDPPDRAARLSYIEGDVGLQPAGEQASAPAQLNRPLTTGDQLWTGIGARAEVQVGPAAIRLADSTDFSIVNLDDDTIQVRMNAGVMRVNVRALNESERIWIETPNVSLTLLHPGLYRVEVNDAGDSTVVKVTDGEVAVDGPSQDVTLRAGNAVTFSGIERVTARYDSLGQPDEFDAWAAERERRDYLASSRSQYVSPDVTGYEDLEEYGTWSTEPEYGNVWTPSYVQSGWSPYSYGRWVSIAPWGWTWIDDAPWGYAPFHYGRWAHVRNRWCWVPGPRHARAVYAPALVGWMGVGQPRASVSWFPLGPRDVYMPDGRYSRRYVERVNVTNTQLIRQAVDEVRENRARNVSYRNRVVPGAVSTVSQATFTSAEHVGHRRVRIDEHQLASMTATARAPRIAPVLESRLGGAPHPSMQRSSQAELTRRAIAERNRQSPATRPAQAPVPDQPASVQQQQRVPPAQRPTQIESTREAVLQRAREQQQQRRDAETQQRRQSQVDQLQRQQEQRQREQQVRERAQRTQDAVREAAARQSQQRESQQRERPIERQRPEPMQQESRPSRPASPPSENRSSKPRDDQPRPQRN